MKSRIVLALGLWGSLTAAGCSGGAPELLFGPGSNDNGDDLGNDGTDEPGQNPGNNPPGADDPTLFDVDGGVIVDNGDTCKTTCASDECGPVADGCGGLVECGDCQAPETCGGGGIPSRCGGTPTCTPLTCADLGKECGSHGDGCGDVIDCWGSAELDSDGNPQCSDGRQCVDGICEVLAECTPLTCDDYAPQTGLCGPVSDGCGDTLDCGFACAVEEICGADEPGVCGTASCDPLTCDEALSSLPPSYCGYVADGCGGELTGCAATCTGGDTCGGGGVADVCGQGAGACTPRTLADCGSQCGPISDGCGSTVDCGGCTAPETCGGGGVASMCGAPACVPLTCQSMGAECGSVIDGCGGTIASCGTCASDEVCNANVCQVVSCTPLTVNQVCSGLCGLQSDGCDGTVDCGGCTAPNTCGGGGTPSVCGAVPCTPTTCQAQGANCGPIGDGCGGVIASCGTCTSPEICGGAGTPSVCGVTPTSCTGLCTYQETCPMGQPTRVTGTVYAPNGTEPLPNVLVYVPNAAIPAIATGPSCDRCADEELGSPLVAAISDTDGTFTLDDVPAGIDFPLVVKIGKWRRVVTIPALGACSEQPLMIDETRLPRDMTDASAANQQYVNIPRMAMVTGEVDELECVLRKIGLSDGEFTLPSGSGRIHLYRANGASYGCTDYGNGQGISNSECGPNDRVFADISELFAGDTLEDYDISIFGCEGAANEHNAYDPLLRDWANRGGRVFASHYSYTYLHDNDDFADTATWGGPARVNNDPTTGIVDTSFAKGAVFNEWLGNVSAYHPTYGNGYIEVDDPRDYVQAAAATSERFVYTDAAHMVNGTSINQQTAVQQFSFNTPVASDEADICGRVLYSAFHVSGATDNDDEVFPAHCSTSALTAQEKVLEYMLFDLSSCVSVGVPEAPTCTPRTCDDEGAECGFLADGCGGLLDCGTCTAPASCGGAGVANQCGTNCTQTTCGAQGANCGTIADGCGGTLNCGTCTAPAVCGGGGTANVCGTPQCQPRTCDQVGAECGPISDGCGSTVDCGVCMDGLVCGGGGTPNVCGTGSCSPLSCVGENAECGFIGDGCGGTIACGNCALGEICGGGGPNQCAPSCVPRDCSAASAECGFIGDGCGGVVSCGVCDAPEVCGGGGTPSVCGGSCTPLTCGGVGAECGAIGDGCGGVVQCGACPPGEVCGAGGTPNQCGAGSCTPQSCEDANAECGSIGDGCSGVLDCGTCPMGESCGGGGVPNQCGQGGCIPLSCADQNADCGPVADGCGGLLDCGSCSGGESCGGAGTPSQCGSIQ